MSYKGKVYRACFFKDNLLKQIKVGKKMINAALWSCTKDENVAKKFKKSYNKNVIIHLNLDEILMLIFMKIIYLNILKKKKF